jgi:hypothetical protein
MSKKNFPDYSKTNKNAVKQTPDEYIPVAEEEFSEDNPYNLWRAIMACESCNIEYPDWIKSRIAKIATQILSLENQEKSYPGQISKILKFGGHARRREEARVRDDLVRFYALKEIQLGKKRKDSIEYLSDKFSLNERQIEGLYDSANTMIKKLLATPYFVDEDFYISE